jgi:hypothetical protein
MSPKKMGSALTVGFLTVSLAVCLEASVAAAAGGGGSEPVPLTNFTDLPSYRPQPVEPVRGGIKHWREHVREHQRASLTITDTATKNPIHACLWSP